MKPGDINEDGKEIEQDGDITWTNDSKGLFEQIQRGLQKRKTT